MIIEIVKICGLSKEEILSKLKVFEGFGVEFSVVENCLDATITMTSDASRDVFETVKSRVYNVFEEEVYSASEGSLEEIAARLLRMNNRTLAVGESLTGGEICSRLTSIAGISANFYEGIVCYNRASKVERLGVPKSVLADCGAVSRETAYAMVKGLCKRPVDIALATTGLAGPTGDEGKPVGLVYIAVGGGEFITVFERRFSGSRNEIRTATSNVALFYLIRYLKGDILRL